MAETAYETAPNEPSTYEVRVPEMSLTAEACSERGNGDGKACDNEASIVEVVTESASMAFKSEDAEEEQVTRGPVEEDLKLRVAVELAIENIGEVGADFQSMNAIVDTKAIKTGGAEVKDEMDIDAEALEDEQTKELVEEKVFMSIDDKNQENVEEHQGSKEEQKAGVVVNPKKRGGRTKRSNVDAKREAEETMEIDSLPIEEKKETNKQSRPKKMPSVSFRSETDRPARERKSIERFVASVDKGNKEIVIKQGLGTALMDIPNVAYKLGKKPKGDEILNMLHSLLFNKRGKANALKYNIYRFSGFVWGENEEKEKRKVKEKLVRYTKEGLGQLIDLLDLRLPKTGKKEELVVKVLQFLESPHKTTDVSLGEKEQRLKEKKRKFRTPVRKRGSGTPGKRRKLEDSTSRRSDRKKNDGCQSDGNGGEPEVSSEDEDLEVEKVESSRLTVKDSDEEDDDDDEDYAVKQKPQKNANTSENEVADERASYNEEEADQALQRFVKGELKASTDTFSLGVKSPKGSSPDITRSTSKPPDKVYSSRKRNKELREKEILVKEKGVENEVAGKKRRGKEKEWSREDNGEQSTGRGWRGKEAIRKKNNGLIPSDEVLQIEIRNLLRDLSPSDFSKVTFMDIVLQLEGKFNVDLSVKKGHVKVLIRQEVSRFAEEGSDGEAPTEIDAPPSGEEETPIKEMNTTESNGKASLSPKAAELDKESDSDRAKGTGGVAGKLAAKDAGKTSETMEAEEPRSEEGY